MDVDEMRTRKEQLADWTRRLNDCKARGKMLTLGDAPEKRAAWAAEVSAIIAEKDRLKGNDNA